MPASFLMAHRGYPARFPENSLEGMRAAIEAGALMVELDVQLSADHVPIVIHDDSLDRTSAEPGCVLDMGWEALKSVDVGERQRFGKQYQQTRIPTLSEMLDLIMRHSTVTAFVEIKRASIQRFGRELMMEKILPILQPYLSRCVVLSFDSKIVAMAKTQGVQKIGFAFKEWTQAACDEASLLKPDYLFCKGDVIPHDAKLWPGEWLWVVYNVNNPDLALGYRERGADIIETDFIGDMLADPQLKPVNVANE